GLSDDELDTYSRQIVLKDIGYEGQLKIRNAKACIVGIGGLGSTISTLLAGMGIGFLRIVDRDVVERANLHRQEIFDVDSIGMPKVEAAEKRIRAINPDVEVEALPVSVNEFNAKRIVEGMDVILDGLDTIATRRYVNRACVELKIPYVFGAAIEMFGNVSTIIPGKTPCLDCFLPGQEPSATCATVGVHPSLVSIIASIEASEAVKLITGAKPSLADKLLFFDLRNMSFETINISRSDSCKTCGGTQPFREAMPVEKFKVEEVCSTRGLSYYLISPNIVFELDLSQPSESEHLKIKARYKLGISLLSCGIEICLLKSGVGIVRGARDGFEALQSYKHVLSPFNPSDT
ncbi:MAG: HesA/MoeB/ThiF family protein, partial [Thermoproteota archaeon]